MPSFVPHTDEDIQNMLKFLGLKSLEELYDHVPQALMLNHELNIHGMNSEFDVIDYLSRVGEYNKGNLICFAGYGSYDRLIPASTKQLSSRSEFVTAYTPYQPEVAQGILQAIFEYQTFITRLYGMDIANASLYDGATSLVESVNIATSSKASKSVVISDGVFHNHRQVLETFARGTQTKVITVADESLTKGTIDFDDDIAAIIVQSPNRYGYLVDLDKIKAVAEKLNCLMIVSMDPIAAAVLKSPGEAGADIAFGEGQPLGMPLAFGGPYLGLFCLKQSVRPIHHKILGCISSCMNPMDKRQDLLNTVDASNG